ncbi:LCP family protein [Actinophytocola sp.]|uniref:LCP family protein n=1 Tax=Actinophytocola sp. TaxID=1872138 RepID=UPI002D7E188E|nr:LCP family protein [Actinophytocola sp.]HET9143248.1 LCP family protein [Actinophytocola sp.]HEU5110533.1 LCP family protein [Micromonosporaceae bacterium]
MNYRPPRASDRYPHDPDQRTERIADARWQPPPDPVRQVRPRPARRPPPSRDTGALTSAKTVVVVLSLLVFALTGYYWSTLNEWEDGLTRQDVIDTAPSERPADGAIDILMVGMDSRTDAQGNPLSKDVLRQLSAGKVDGTLNTDTLIMIRIPNDGGKAIGISMPRDSYVEIPGYGKHKINSAYVRAKNDAMERLRKGGQKDQAKLEVESNLEGAKNLIATVEKLTGAEIDHYAEINLLGFYDITNAVGGIEVCLNKAVDDNLSGAHLPAGKQTLSGAPALSFVRQRHGLPNGDLDRIVRQQVFMAGMAKKVFSSEMLKPGSETLDALRAAVQKSVVLDQDWNVIQFAQQMMGFTGGNLEFKTIPVGSIALRTGDGDAVEVNPRDVKSFVTGLLHGGGQPASDAPAPDEAPADSSITVDVRNASGRTGLAGQVSQALEAQGFRAGETGNSNARATSVVRFAAGEDGSGERVAAALGGLPAEADQNVPKGHVTVLLGRDFKLGAQRAPADQPAASGPSAGPQRPDSPPADGCVN